jgi:hypothetical protein
VVGVLLALQATSSILKRISNTVLRIATKFETGASRIKDAVKAFQSVGGFLRGGGRALKALFNIGDPMQQRVTDFGESAGRFSRVRSGLGRVGQSMKTLGRGSLSPFVTDEAFDAVKIGLPRGIGPQKLVSGKLGKALSSIPFEQPDGPPRAPKVDDAVRLMTDGGQIIANERQSGLGRLSNLFGRVPTKLDDIISAIRTVDVSINSLDEILAKGGKVARTGGSILSRIGIRGGLAAGGGIAAILANILTRGKSSGLGKILKGGRIGRALKFGGNLAGVSVLRSGKFSSFSLPGGLQKLTRLLTPKSLRTAISKPLSKGLQRLGSTGLRRAASRVGLRGVSKVLAGRVSLAIPVIGGLINALDLLTMAITFAIPGMKMFSPVRFILEKLFNVTKDFVKFLSDLTLDDIISGITDSRFEQRQNRTMAAPGQDGVSPSKIRANAITGQPNDRRDTDRRNAPGTNIGAFENETQPRNQFNVTVNAENQDEEGLVNKIIDRITNMQRKEEQFYGGE